MELNKAAICQLTEALFYLKYHIPLVQMSPVGITWIDCQFGESQKKDKNKMENIDRRIMIGYKYFII